LPSIICDIIEYLTEINIETIVNTKRQKNAEDSRKKRFVEEAHLLNERDPNLKVTEQDLYEKYIKENKTPEDFKLEDWVWKIGD